MCVLFFFEGLESKPPISLFSAFCGCCCWWLWLLLCVVLFLSLISVVCCWECFVVLFCVLRIAAFRVMFWYFVVFLFNMG